MDLRNLEAHPIVQLSLDLTSIEEAIDTAAIGVEAGVDWLEAGLRCCWPRACTRSRSSASAFRGTRSSRT
jgi:3-hexulose-6-phosphate synthase/6-phospho-3-hexuloisomerase